MARGGRRSRRFWRFCAVRGAERSPVSEGLNSLRAAPAAKPAAKQGVGPPADRQGARDRLQYLATLLGDASADGRPPSRTAEQIAGELAVETLDGRPDLVVEQNGVKAAIARCSSESLGAIAHVLADRARMTPGAKAFDGEARGPLSGVAFVAKNAFEVKGLPTYAGGPFHAGIEPATADATAIADLTAAGATLVGTSHMDEYAYGFLGHNAHHGRVSNPRAPDLIAGGSSSGSAAAVAGGLVPLALGTDTNGSIRVPAALCGVFGIKPGFDGVSRNGLRSLAPSLDHVGLLAADPTLLEIAFRVLTGAAIEERSPIGRTLLGMAGGDFQDWCDAGIWREIESAVPLVADAPRVMFRGLAEEFAAASIITAVEARRVHASDLDRYPDRYSAEVRTKLHAAEQVSQRVYERAKTIQARVRDKYLSCLAKVDVLMVPALPIFAPRIGVGTVTLRGVELRAPDALSLFVRPFSLAGLPALTLPLSVRHLRGVALQLVCAPGAEDRLWPVARLIASQKVIGEVVPRISDPARSRRECNV
jgi:Asp-tRNA(Asn)/Glu-tRNA(Gln) amidotransferase A subunit family amidase